MDVSVERGFRVFGPTFFSRSGEGVFHGGEGKVVLQDSKYGFGHGTGKLL